MLNEKERVNNVVFEVSALFTAKKNLDPNIAPFLVANFGIAPEGYIQSFTVLYNDFNACE